MHTQLPVSIILYGPSGSGKGTQAALLEEYLADMDPQQKTLHLTTGRQLRQFVEEEGHTQTLARNVVDRGELMPAFLPIWIWTKWLIEHFTGSENLIFDGLARRPHAAPILAEAIAFYGRTPAHVVFLDVPRTVAVSRLQERAREDDTDAEINRRLDWFDTEVKPAIAYFETHPDFHFHTIDGTQDIEDVHRDIIKGIWQNQK